MKTSFAAIGAVALAAIALSSPTVDAREQDSMHPSRMAKRHRHIVERAENTSEVQSLNKRGYSGKGTYYNTETGNAGSCGNMLSNNAFTVAVAGGIMNSGLCGKKVTITANGKTAQATIADTCPPGGGQCFGSDLDMSPALFKYFGNLGLGVLQIQWSIGGSSGGGNSGGNSGDSGDDDDDHAAEEAAARKKKAAQDAKDAAEAAAASKSSASEAAKSSASASSASIVSASRASVASVSRASVASISRASAASVSSERHESRVSAAAAAKESKAAAKEEAEAEAARPKNLEHFAAIMNEMSNMVNAAKD